MALGIADVPLPDAVLMAACAAARAAVAAYNAEAEKDELGDELAGLFDRERLALECVATTGARTPLGIAEKALLIEACPQSPVTGCSASARRTGVPETTPFSTGPRVEFRRLLGNNKKEAYSCNRLGTPSGCRGARIGRAHHDLRAQQSAFA
jgi:hypothetical protein